MPIFRPTKIFDKIFNITTDELKKIGIKAVFLDVDNTISLHATENIVDGIVEWIENVKNSGIDVMLVSNGRGTRISNIASTLCLPYKSMAMKPLPFGLISAKRGLKLKSSEVLLIGDQIFTDVLAANLSGIPVYLVKPFVYESSWYAKYKRNLERKLVASYEKRGKK